MLDFHQCYKIVKLIFNITVYNLNVYNTFLNTGQ